MRKSKSKGSSKRRHCQSGFVLFEALLAFLIFGVAAVGIVLAFHKFTQTDLEISQEIENIAIAEVVLAEIEGIPRLGNDFERSETMMVNEQVTAQIQVDQLERRNQDDFALENIYEIKIRLHWLQDPDREDYEVKAVFNAALNAP